MVNSGKLQGLPIYSTGSDINKDKKAWDHMQMQKTTGKILLYICNHTNVPLSLKCKHFISYYKFTNMNQFSLCHCLTIHSAENQWKVEAPHIWHLQNDINQCIHPWSYLIVDFSTLRWQVNICPEWCYYPVTRECSKSSFIGIWKAILLCILKAE